MKKIFLIGFVILIVTTTNNSFAQCSDAGVCQLGFVYEEKTPKKFDVGISYSLGTSGKDEEVKFHSVNFDISYQPFGNTKFTAIIPYNSQSGMLGDVSGIGDLILSLTQNIYSARKQNVSFIVGAKVATGDDNQGSLPQIYQSGLGSNDMLIGINYSRKNVLIGIGYQVAGGRNDNGLTKLERGDDLITRGSYTFEFNKLNIAPQLLLIKRIGNSSVLDLTVEEQQFVEIEDSDQLQINFLVKANYSINKDMSLVAEVAIPFLKRDVNVDGLTRVFSAGVGFRYKF
ncbi:MAG: transporter [Ignavibacteriae bacterium]|nr:transporter [Ignavibacteriota bacterium]